MRAVDGDDFGSTGGDSGDEAFERIEVLGLEAAAVALLVPGGMAVEAEDQLGADASDFTGGARRFDVAEVGEEVDEAGQAFGERRIFRASVCRARVTWA